MNLIRTRTAQTLRHSCSFKETLNVPGILQPLAIFKLNRADSRKYYIAVFEDQLVGLKDWMSLKVVAEFELMRNLDTQEYVKPVIRVHPAKQFDRLIDVGDTLEALLKERVLVY